MSAIKLHVMPHKTMTQEEFTSTWPNARCIALDGFVAAPPFRHVTKTGYAFNFDHHTGGDRLSMRSTSGQVLLALKLGLASQLDNADVFVNDCDQDVCLATWLLSHPHRVVDTSEPLLNRLIWAEDVLDVTGGSYPFPKSSGLRETLYWIFAPYEESRSFVHTMTATQMQATIEAVWKRIDDYLMGAGQKTLAREASSMAYTILNSDHRAVFMVREHEPGARRAMARAGIRSFISVDPQPNGRWLYKIGTFVPFSYFPLPKIYDALNKEEAFKYMGLGQPWSVTQGWGGSDLIGGGPRSGSLLSPDAVYSVVLTEMG